MGCSDREELTAEELAYEKKEKQVIAAIHSLPLSKLTVADSLSLHGAFFHRHFGIGRSDIEMMEKILERVGKLSI
jgi:hypothetical protein